MLADSVSIRNKVASCNRLQDKRPPGQKATGQKATAPRGVFSGAYLNTFENGNFKLTGIRKNIHIFIHQKFFTQQAKHPCTRI